MLALISFEWQVEDGTRKKYSCAVYKPITYHDFTLFIAILLSSENFLSDTRKCLTIFLVSTQGLILFINQIDNYDIFFEKNTFNIYLQITKLRYALSELEKEIVSSYIRCESVIVRLSLRSVEYFFYLNYRGEAHFLQKTVFIACT